MYFSANYGAIQLLYNADEGGGVQFFGEKCYEGVRFNVITVTTGGGPISRKCICVCTCSSSVGRALWGAYIIIEKGSSDINHSCTC